jgi:adenosylmethionine-8-amino-7-oxononanoate aminotransferase
MPVGEDAKGAVRRGRVLEPNLARRYPVAVRAHGVWLEGADGERYLDAMSGGSMAATLGYGRDDLVAAGRAQLARIAHVHNERLTNPLQERLAAELLARAPAGFQRVRFVSGGAEANEMVVQLARTYHVERGDIGRWQVISHAQAYHGPTMETLALTGRPGLWGPFVPYLPHHLHFPPSTWRFDPSGEGALAAIDRAVAEAGEDAVSLVFLEPVSAAALPGVAPPPAFFAGLAERRERYGFLVGFDEVVTGMGRTGSWFAAQTVGFTPDLIATAKGLGAGYAPIGAVLVGERVAQVIESGSKRFTLGHTWDGSPFACAVGVAVVDALEREGHIPRVREAGAHLRDELAKALAEVPMVHGVAGEGFLLGVHFVDPRDGVSLLPRELRVAARIDEAAMRHRLVTLSTQPTGDGFAGDQTLVAPAFVASDAELEEIVKRVRETVLDVWREVEAELEARP